MYPEINIQSEIKIKNTLSRILKDIVIVNHLPKINSSYVLFEELSRELNKRKTNFKVDTHQAISIFIDAFLSNIEFIASDSDMDEGEVNIQNVDDIEDITLKILECFKATPRHYTVKVSLGNMKMPSAELLGEVSIHSPIQEKRISSLIARLLIKPLQMTTTIKGYYSNHSEAYFIKEAFQNFNVLIFFLLTKEVVIRSVKWDYSSKYNSIYYENNQEVTVVEATIENNDSPKASEFSKIPLPISKYLSELEFKSSMDLDTIKIKLEDCIAMSDVIIKDTNRGVSRIKSAIGWYINSQVTDDSTMSFLQICMGLESIFGDDGDSDGGLTKMLANRCSYLIGRNLKERDFICSRFKEIYRIRSIIVHGVRSDLSYDEVDIKNDAAQYLIRSINKEVTNIVI